MKLASVEVVVMPKDEEPDDAVDRRLATWDGSRREALRRSLWDR